MMLHLGRRSANSVYCNEGQGNCLYLALAGLDLGGKARMHRQLRRYAMQPDEHRSTLEPLWTAGGSYNCWVVQRTYRWRASSRRLSLTPRGAAHSSWPLLLWR